MYAWLGFEFNGDIVPFGGSCLKGSNMFTINDEYDPIATNYLTQVFKENPEFKEAIRTHGWIKFYANIDGLIYVYITNICDFDNHAQVMTWANQVRCPEGYEEVEEGTNLSSGARSFRCVYYRKLIRGDDENAN